MKTLGCERNKSAFRDAQVESAFRDEQDMARETNPPYNSVNFGAEKRTGSTNW